MYCENKAAVLTSQLRNNSRENKNIRTELDQMMKYYDNANGQVNQMEMALEKAGIKFAESQALVEKLEQDLMKIKLQYSLEVKELEMKVRSAEGKEQHVQVVKPFRFQDGNEAQSPRSESSPENVMTSTKELNTTKQRLTDEAEMTEGFKMLLKDLHELMSNIKDSSVVLRRESNASKKNVPTADNLVLDKTPTTIECNRSKTSRSHNDKIITDNEASDIILPSVTLHERSRKGKGAESKRKRDTGAPLHSSSPKSSSPVCDIGSCNDYTINCNYSDISDVESDSSEGRQDWGNDNSSETRRLKSLQKPSKLKGKIDTYFHPEDVDSLLMPHEVPSRSHRRAKKILDLLTVKGQALTNGNKKIAKLISRQDDGIKRCQEAEQTIKGILM